jgi:hypothetical protein
LVRCQSQSTVVPLGFDVDETAKRSLSARPRPPYRARRLRSGKASDEFAVPLCRVHHRSVHRAGDERAWWKGFGIDPIKVARKLWKHTRVNEGRIRLERTIPTIDSDILNPIDGKTPE